MAKSNLGRTPRQCMKSITQIEDCIIHIEYQFASVDMPASEGDRCG
ncbi:hypothetical protein VULLAG_LOCUS555 [Vulpes lagopus]